jgi:fluoride ion exporter CrcB/FEX
MLVLSFLYLNDHHRVEIAIACLVVTFAAKPLSRVKDLSWILGVLVSFALITVGVLNNIKPMLPANITGLGSAIFVILGVWVGLTTLSSILKQVPRLNRVNRWKTTCFLMLLKLTKSVIGSIMITIGNYKSEVKMTLLIPRDTVAKWSLLATEVFILFVAAIYVGLDHGNPNLLIGFALGLLVITPAFRLCAKSMVLSAFVGAIILIAV